MLYCRGLGWVLHAIGVVQSPWNRLSGVPVFLHDDDDVLERGDLCRGRRRKTERR
jgi:hypothetical protein